MASHPFLNLGIGNYRPISLLSAVSKVLERLVYRKCCDFLESSLSPTRFGFLQGCSTVQQMLLFYATIFEPICSGGQFDVIFLDFAKAFDSVPHQELLLRLRQLGISGDIWLWLEDYFRGRMQCVCLNGTRSGLLPVVSGVPQGSILGPLLFLAYINDLPDATKHSHLLRSCGLMIASASCADDCDLLQEDLNSLVAWSVQMKLKFKVSKCASVSIGKKLVHASSYAVNGDQGLAKQLPGTLESWWHQTYLGLAILTT